jgi:integrase
MASIRKHKNKWRAEVRIKKFFASKIFDTQAQAKDWAHEIERMVKGHGGQLVSSTLGQAMQKYADEISPTKKGARWELVRLKKLQRDRLADFTLLSLQTQDIQDWIETQEATLSGASINRELNLIAAVLRVARQKWKYMTTDIMDGVVRPKSTPPRRRRISDEEIKKLMRALEYKEGKPVQTPRQRIALSFLLALETAMRHGEIYALEWQDVFLKERYVRLHETKNGTSRDVGLSLRAVEILKMLKAVAEGNKVIGVRAQTAEVIYRRAVELAGITDLTFHDTRHEGITRLARKLDVLDLAEMVGHRDIRSLRIYYNPTASEIAKRLD